MKRQQTGDQDDASVPLCLHTPRKVVSQSHHTGDIDLHHRGMQCQVAIGKQSRIAKARGWHRLYWHTDAGNLPARRLYDRFIASDGHIRYRLPLA